MSRLAFFPILIFGLVWTKGHGQNPTDESYQLYLTQVAAAEAFLQLNKISTAKEYLNACAEEYRDVEWDFLHAFLDQSRQTITKGEEVGFSDVELSPDGKTLAVAASDSTITIYTIPEMQVQYELKGHKSGVNTIDFSHDGKFIASGGRDHTVIVWDLESMEMKWKNDHSFSQGIYQVRFSQDDSKVGVVSWELVDRKVEGFAKILDATTGAEQKRIYTEPHPAAGIVFTDQDQHIVVSCWGERVYCFDIATGEQVWLYDLYDAEGYNSFHSIDLSPDGKHVVVGSTDHRIYTLSADSGTVEHTIEPWEGHTKTIKALAYTPDGSRFASAGEDQTIYVWDAATYTKQYTLIGHTEKVASLCWANGSTLISVSADGEMRVWDVNKPFERTYKGVCEYGPWQNPLTSDGRYFVAACTDKNVSMYEASTGKLHVKLGEHSAICADASADDKYAVTSSWDGVVRLWNIAEGKEQLTLEGHTSRVDGIAFLDATQQIVSVGDTTLRVWSVKDGSDKIVRLSTRPFRLVLSPDEQTAYIGSRSGKVLYYNTKSWKHEVMLEGTSELNEMAVSPDGKYLATFCGRVIEIWNTSTHELVYSLTGHDEGGYAVGFSSDSRYLVSGSYDQTFKLWNLEKNGMCTLTFHGYDHIVYTSKFIGDRVLLIGSSQGLMHYYSF